MFNLGFTEMLFIAGLALILIGPKQLPEVARTIGRLMNDLRRSTNVFTEELKAQTEIDLRSIREKEHQKIIQSEPTPTPPPTEEKKS